jgi:hypothetical protein
MKIVVACISLWVGLQAASLQRSSFAASFQPGQGNPRAVVPENLPPPVGKEMRVKGDDIDTLLAEGKVLFLDVREPWELEQFGAHPGYINIPLSELEKRLRELPKDKAILTA